MRSVLFLLVMIPTTAMQDTSCHFGTANTGTGDFAVIPVEMSGQWPNCAANQRSWNCAFQTGMCSCDSPWDHAFYCAMTEDEAIAKVYADPVFLMTTIVPPITCIPGVWGTKHRPRGFGGGFSNTEAGPGGGLPGDAVAVGEGGGSSDPVTVGAGGGSCSCQ